MVFTTVCFIPLSFSLLTYLAFQFPNFWSRILLLIKLTLTGLMQIGLMVAGFVIFYGKFFVNISVLKALRHHKKKGLIFFIIVALSISYL